MRSECKFEWWHFVGNLRAETNERFGFQVTFFRKKVMGRQAFVVHVAISDITRRKYYQAERKTRHAYVAEPFSICAKGCFLSMRRLLAEADEFSLDLSLFRDKPAPVVHEKPGYYSITDIATEGEIRINGEVFQVFGSSWMDHEFFSKPCAGVTGWDWFGLQLSRNMQLMIYRLRGKYPPASGATLIQGGIGKCLPPGSFTVLKLDHHGAYPSLWNLSVPSEGIHLLVTPEFPDQEFRSRILNLNYWEGAVAVSGTHIGVGYAELTGYNGIFRAFSKWHSLKTYLTRR